MATLDGWIEGYTAPKVKGKAVDFGNLDRMAGREDKAYREFVEKFKPKRTTDDCFTPPPVYEAVLQWVKDTYGDLGEVVRPFYPGGDYKGFNYPEGCTVVDNPPFSIMSEILRFYQQTGVRFFLFANHLTLFSSLRVDGVNAVLTGASVIYENGADVSTSFLTNLEGPRIRVAGTLHHLVEAAVPRKTKDIKAYSYPAEFTNAALLGRLSKYGIDLDIPHIQVVAGVGDHRSFGRGVLMSRREAEMVKAEMVKAERAKIPVTLGEREMRIIAELDRRDAEC